MLKTLFECSHIIALIGGLITAIASGFVLYFDDPRLQMRANKKTFAIVGLIGGILTIIAALFSTLDNNVKNETILTYSKSSNNKINILSNKSDTILTNNDTIIVLNKTIQSLSNKIIRLQDNIINQTKNLKYIINDSFKLHFGIEFHNKNLVNYLKSNPQIYNNIYGTIDCRYIGKCINDWSISVDLSKNKKKYTADSYLVLVNKFTIDSLKKYSYNYDQNCLGYGELKDGIELNCTIPLKIQSMYELQTLDDLKNSDIEITIGFNNFSNIPDLYLKKMLTSDFKINSLAISHKYDMIIGAKNFIEMEKNEFNVKYKSKKLWYRKLK